MDDKITRNPIETAIVIPARLESTRFPRKMLQEVIPGVTLIEHVYNQCVEEFGFDRVYVATDTMEIGKLFGHKAIITPDAPNGTSRVAWAAKVLPEYDAFINVQGDMIDVPLYGVQLLGEYLEMYEDVDVCTIVTKMDEEDQINPNTVKCIHNDQTARWFCRGALGYGDWHLGVYGYKREALEQYNHLEIFPEEEKESLEQLRWLQNSYNIDIVHVINQAAEINTPEDLTKWQQTHQS